MTLFAYRFALDPTPRQERALRSHAGAARAAFNWGLARVKANLSQREAERSYGMAEAELIPCVDWSLYGLRKAWNAAKEQVAPWWRECSKEAFNTGLGQLARALRNWSDSKRGKRKGRRVGFPRFRSKRKARPSIRFTTGAVRCEARHAVLPRVGRVKLHEPGSRLAGRIVCASVRFERGRWFVSFTVEADARRPGPVLPDAVVGVDLGIKTLATLSTGERVPNPRHLDRARRKVRRLSRAMARQQGPDRRVGRRDGSGRWQATARALTQAHGRVADARRDAQHKLTTRLAATYGTLVAEDLNVAGMVGNRRLARAVADAAFGEIRRQLAYKTAWRGGTLIVADRWFPSSKTCSACGAVRTKLLLSERTYVCGTCGLILDRDANAAVNLAGYGRHLAGSGPDSRNGRGADRKTPSGAQVAVKRQPGTRTRGQTGTVPTQDGTAT